MGKDVSGVFSVGLGALLILCVVPTVHWLDRGAIANNMEMDAPNPLGVGVVVALVAVNALFHFIGARRLLRPRTLLVLYVMLSVSLPLCNIGVIAPLFGSLQAAAREVYHRSEPDKAIHIYEWQSPSLYPKLPDELYRHILSLRDPAYARQRGTVDAKAESRMRALPLIQFWDGMYVSTSVKQDFESRGALGRIRAAWDAVPWRIWKPVCLSWGVFLSLVVLGTMLLAQVLQQEWTERENLPFPVAQAALALIDPAGTERQPAAFSRNPFFLGGLALSVLVLLLSGLAHYGIAGIPLTSTVSFQRIMLAGIFVREPFSTLANNVLFLSPVMIGIALLIHQEILRGAVAVFAILQLARLLAGMHEEAISEALGPAWHGNRMPYYPEIGTGAVLALSAVMIWRSREAFAFWRRPAGDCETGHYLWPRWSGPAFLVVLAAAGVFIYRAGAEGMGGAWVLCIMFLWTFGAAIAVARCRTEGALTSSSTTLITNQVMDPAIGWAAHLSPANVKTLALGEWLAVSTIPGLLAAQIEGIHMAKRLRISPRLIALAAAVAFLLSIATGLISFLVLSYWTGGMNNSQMFFSGMAVAIWKMGGDLLHRRGPVDWLWLGMILFGAAAMMSLYILRKWSPRFPLPPICLPIVCLGTVPFQTGFSWLHPVYSAGPYVCFVWGPMLAAFIIKKLILRYGGMDLYVRFLPAAFGLIAGQALMIVLWNLYHLIAAPENVRVFAGVFC